MARPERPVVGDGPIAELARVLRRIRKRAGNPGYRDMAETAMFSKETLAAAARGEQCPSWEAARAFADACDPTGAEARRLRPLWEKANQESKKARRRHTRSASPARAVRGGTPRAAGGVPHPDPAGSPAEYVYQLRALRAWSGIPNSSSDYRGMYRLAPSTLHDALSPRRTTLPTLRVVKLILAIFLEDDSEAAKEWVDAWRAITLHEFTRVNPPAADGTPDLRIVSNQ